MRGSPQEAIILSCGRAPTPNVQFVAALVPPKVQTAASRGLNRQLVEIIDQPLSSDPVHNMLQCHCGGCLWTPHTAHLQQAQKGCSWFLASITIANEHPGHHPRIAVLWSCGTENCGIGEAPTNLLGLKMALMMTNQPSSGSSLPQSTSSGTLLYTLTVGEQFRPVCALHVFFGWGHVVRLGLDCSEILRFCFSLEFPSAPAPSHPLHGGLARLIRLSLSGTAIGF
ncbi:hypothetical protein BJ875DRAFT_95163 [Amylocarpus encephaloides]|uniref:Uncharacterized protein n=1 Tax=Amylocarpus encephaloides TaxID=45428 RepID=A0A9P8C931_9HELO|nr:hypothetical protein BJ875DRAFT_95163 [Amylocarpus encephaloides]